MSFYVGQGVRFGREEETGKDSIIMKRREISNERRVIKDRVMRVMRYASSFVFCLRLRLDFDIQKIA
jgi:hypothetical protein